MIFRNMNTNISYCTYYVLSQQLIGTTYYVRKKFWNMNYETIIIKKGYVFSTYTYSEKRNNTTFSREGQNQNDFQE